ncbi:MAG: PH domain-containing protein [Deltaproteobacteria bacterium]|jgi:hypothetical protein|nr:PH domain-containing protein [Deltaproteobacteria bacterium]
MAFFPTDFSEQIMENAHLGLFGTFGVGRELKQLSDMLLGDETVLAVTRGRVDTTGWLMAVTSSRVILLSKGLLFGYRHLEVPLDQVKTASCKTGLLSGAIFIDTGGGTVVLEGINKKSTVEVASIISQAINDYVKKEAQAKKASAVDDLTAHLERLVALRDKGALTDMEFAAQKRRLLGKSDLVKVVEPAPPQPKKVETRS